MYAPEHFKLKSRFMKHRGEYHAALLPFLSENNNIMLQALHYVYNIYVHFNFSSLFTSLAFNVLDCLDLEWRSFIVLLKAVLNKLFVSRM